MKAAHGGRPSQHHDDPTSEPTLLGLDFTTGELLHDPFGAGDWRERFQEWLMDFEKLDPAFARDLGYFAKKARADGSLRDESGVYYDEKQLAAWLRVSVWTFRRRWKRWAELGLVTTTGRPDQGRVERWLVPGGRSTVELKAAPSSGRSTLEAKAAPSLKGIIDFGEPHAHARGSSGAPQSSETPGGRGDRPGLQPMSDREYREWRGRVGDPADCLRLGLDLLAVGVAAQMILPDERVVECLPDDHGPLMRLLGNNNPQIAVAALITDKPSVGVLSGAEKFRFSRRVQQANPGVMLPLHRVLAAFENHGYRAVRKGRSWHSRCPGHERSQPDHLQIRELASGKVAIKCFKSCDYLLVLGIVGLKPHDLYPTQSVAVNRNTMRKSAHDRDEDDHRRGRSQVAT